MKIIVFVITVSVLTSQGCTVYIGPAERESHVHAPSVSASQHQAATGPKGVPGPQFPTGDEGQAGQMMARSNAAPANQPLHARAQPPESKSFGGKFWEGVVSNVLGVAAPVIVNKLIN